MTKGGVKARGGLGGGFKEEDPQGASSGPVSHMGKLSLTAVTGPDQCPQISQFFERSQKPVY